MFRFVHILALLICLFSQRSFSEVTTHFINALIQVESGGMSHKVGDNGNAIGVLQIWDVVLNDVNKTSKIKYTSNDRKSRSKSIAICKYYLEKYGKIYQRKTGKRPTHEVYARIWNGGPNGHRKPSTLKYWNKVRQKL